MAALFLIIGMAVLVILTYRQERIKVQEHIDHKMQIAQGKLLFELYTAYEVADQLKVIVPDYLPNPENLLIETRSFIRRYPIFYSCYVAFPEYFFPNKGKWYGISSYRPKDTVFSAVFGDKDHDYFKREWYNGALESSKKGFWSQQYSDEDIDEPIFTYSDALRDADGNLICVVGLDFSVSWLHHLLEQFKPFEKAILVLNSSNGTLLAASDNLKGQDPSSLSEDSWILSRKQLDPIGIDMIVAVPRLLIWDSIRLNILLPLIIFVLGIIVVGLLIRRMLQDQKARDYLETENEVMEHELQIAHRIQMGILREDFPRDNDVELRADLLPVREVGGDLYDFYKQGDILWFIIGDVSGKGVPAAMFMSAAVNLFRSALRHQTSPKAIMEDMNAVLSNNNPSMTFVTAFIGHLHIPSGQLLYCNAGHLLPLVKDAEYGVKSIEMKANIPLGFDGGYKYVEEGFVLKKDETLVLYTDGVTEARNVGRKMMGDQKWMEIVAGGKDLMAAVKDYIGTADPTDDITLMTIRKLS